jgi:hypothetical protein
MIKQLFMKSIKVEFPDRIEYRNEQGELHRTDGPAIEYSYGTKAWWINGKPHREDGPAAVYSNGDKEWYLDGFEYTEHQWEQEIAKIKLKRILDL